jgi:ribosomal-protein-alanine N-acetyltransferase
MPQSSISAGYLTSRATMVRKGSTVRVRARAFADRPLCGCFGWRGLLGCPRDAGRKRFWRPRRILRRRHALRSERPFVGPVPARLCSVADVSTPDELRAAFTPLETDRLLLRAVDSGDVDAVFAVHGNPVTYRFHPSGATRSREESAAQLADWQHEWQEVGFGFWAVSVAPDPRVVGFGGVTRRIFHECPVLNTYYRFDPSAWGKGYATEMARAAGALARRLLPELPIIVRTRPGNLAAQAVAEKLGLAHAVDLDDHLLTYVSRWDAPGGGGRSDLRAG